MPAINAPVCVPAGPLWVLFSVHPTCPLSFFVAPLLFFSAPIIPHIVFFFAYFFFKKYPYSFCPLRTAGSVHLERKSTVRCVVVATRITKERLITGGRVAVAACVL